MSHSAQRSFCKRVKSIFPEYFTGKTVLDIGSLDINGSNRGLFENCDYTGIDLGPGPNVDIVSPAHEFQGGPFDVVVSTEAFEHDPYIEKTLKHIVSFLLKSGGLFFFTCATTGRSEHGTAKESPFDSPYTLDYYRPLTIQDIMGMIPINEAFNRFEFSENGQHKDLYFWGTKA